MAYAKQTFSVEETLTSTKLNQVSDNIEYMIRSLVPGRKFATGKIQLTFDGSSPVRSGQVTFATDAEDGDPGFTSPPIVLVSFDWSTGDALDVSDVCECYSRVVTTTDCDVVVVCGSIPGNTSKRTIRWIAIGV